MIHLEQVVGTLSIDRKVEEGVDLEADLRLLEIVGNITAEAVAACRLEHEEREKMGSRLIHLPSVGL